jgi:hypothetical protein
VNVNTKKDKIMYEKTLTKARSLKWIMGRVHDDFGFEIDTATAQLIKDAKNNGAGILWSSKHLVIMSRDLEMTIEARGIKYGFTWYTPREWMKCEK